MQKRLININPKAFYTPNNSTHTPSQINIQFAISPN